LQRKAAKKARQKQEREAKRQRAAAEAEAQRQVTPAGPSRAPSLCCALIRLTSLYASALQLDQAKQLPSVLRTSPSWKKSPEAKAATVSPPKPPPPCCPARPLSWFRAVPGQAKRPKSVLFLDADPPQRPQAASKQKKQPKPQQKAEAAPPAPQAESAVAAQSMMELEENPVDAVPACAPLIPCQSPLPMAFGLSLTRGLRQEKQAKQEAEEAAAAELRRAEKKKEQNRKKKAKKKAKEQVTDHRFWRARLLRS